MKYKFNKYKTSFFQYYIDDDLYGEDIKKIVTYFRIKSLYKSPGSINGTRASFNATTNLLSSN